MINKNKYSPIIKTGDAEMTALRGLDEKIKEKMIPLIEITRGRKAKNDTEGNVAKRLKQLYDIYSRHSFIMDLTSEHDLSNKEIKNLYSPNNGYENWVKFCINQKNNFPKMYPVIQMQEEDNYDIYIKNILTQVKNLIAEFGFVVFRTGEASAKKVIADIIYLLDSKTFDKLEEKIIFVLDYEYINDSTSGIDNAISSIKYLAMKLNINNIIIAATSFPSNVFNTFKDGENSTILEIKEIAFFNNIKEKLKNENIPKLNLIYGDYALINPTRNDGVTMARGWIPRMDTPSFDLKVHLERERRTRTLIGKNEKGKPVYEYGRYVDAYESLAERVITKPFFQIVQPLNCWGVREIINAANSLVSSSSPSFWIAVRMNIHINLTVKRFYLF